MPEKRPCRATDEWRWKAGSTWEYRGAQPVRPVLLPGGTEGVADAMFVWAREYEIKYVCSCGGKTAEIWVGGNFAYWESIRYGPFTMVPASPPAGIADVGPAVAQAVGQTPGINVDWTPESRGELDSTKDAPADDAEPLAQPRKLAPAPIAICGEQIDMGEEKIPWPADGSTGGGGTGGTVQPPVEPVPPPPPWEERHHDCCKDLTPLQRRPVVTVRPSPTVYRDGGTLYFDAVIEVTHVCGLRRGPKVTEFVISGGQAIPVPGSRAKKISTPDGKGDIVQWRRQNAPQSATPRGILIRIEATSNCMETIHTSVFIPAPAI